jgi:hypothetical protein
MDFEVAYTGGKPKPDWSGLVDAPKCHNVNCERPSSNYERRKAYNKRSEPTDSDKTFKKGDDSFDLRAFALSMESHAKKHGLDTIVYVPSMTDPSVCVTVLTQYEQVTPEHVTSQLKLLQPKYDDYDNDNVDALRQYLIARLDAGLLKQVSLRIGESHMDDTHPAELWMQIVRLVLDVSTERYNRLNATLKTITLQKSV